MVPDFTLVERCTAQQPIWPLRNHPLGWNAMEFLSHYIIEPDHPRCMEVRALFKGVSVRDMVRDLKLIVADLGWPSVYHFDKDKVGHAADSEVVIHRIMDGTSMYATHLLRPAYGDWHFVVSITEIWRPSDGQENSLKIEVAVPWKLGELPAISSVSAKDCIRRFAALPGLTEAALRITKEYGHPYDKVEAALKWNWGQYIPRIKVVTRDFLDQDGKRERFLEQGFAIEELPLGLALVIREPAAGQDTNEYVCDMAERLARVARGAEWETDPLEGQDLLFASTINPGDLRRYLAGYAARAGRFATTTVYIRNEPRQYRLDQPLINDSVVPIEIHKANLKILNAEGRRLVKDGAFDYPAKTGHEILYKVDGDRVWALAFSLLQWDHISGMQDAAQVGRIGAHLCLYDPAKSSRRKPIPVDGRGNRIVNLQTFTRSSSLSLDPDRLLATAGPTELPFMSMECIAFPHAEPRALAVAVRRLAQIWMLAQQRVSVEWLGA